MKIRHAFIFGSFLALAAASSSASAQIITTFAGTGYGASTATGGYSGDGGAAVAARLFNPTSVATYGFYNVYIADGANHVIRKVDAAGKISTVAGTGAAGNSGNNDTATKAKLDLPYGIAVDAGENIYIADYNRHVVRKINNAGIITRIAGNDTAGYSGDGGAATAAKLHHPHGLALDVSGNLYIADAGNNTIRKVSTDGTIHTVAGTGFGAGLGVGNGGNTGNGGAATAARLNYPKGVATDPSGNLYIADAANHSVRKVDASGIITLVAGTGTTGNSGDGGAATQARLNYVSGVAIDMAGNVVISDQGNNTIRMINAAGTISRVAGDGTNGYSGDGGYAPACRFNSPASITVDGVGMMYVADYANNVIRKIDPTAVVTAVNNVDETTGMQVSPNPSTGTITVRFAGNGVATLAVTDMLGRVQQTRYFPNGIPAAGTTISHLPSGTYLISLTTGAATHHERIVVTQ